uniref:Uncharacterized protein n=1 Tax=Anguilla anguilla TaxID=7936 RepID=A0A0E9UPZ3_ANGAN
MSPYIWPNVGEWTA